MNNSDKRYVDARSKRALNRLRACGYPLKIILDGEEFEILTYRENDSVYFYMVMTHAVDENLIKKMLSIMMKRSEIDEEIVSKNEMINRVLTLDDIISGYSKK